jgi:hypothetical protein
VATWAWPTWVVSRRRVLEAVFILLEFPSPSRRIFIGSHSLPPVSGSPYRSFKVEPGLRGSRVMSCDWRRLHRVRGVSSGLPENHWVPWLIHKAKTEEPKTVQQQLQTGVTGGSDRSVRWVLVWPVRSTGLTGVRRRSLESSKRRTRFGITCLASRLSTWNPSSFAFLFSLPIFL